MICFSFFFLQAFHYTATYEQRYTVRKVDLGEKQLLELLNRGVRRIHDWMVNQSLPAGDIAAFDRDRHHPLGQKGATLLKDIPAAKPTPP
jgi:hypothetical protein